MTSNSLRRPTTIWLLLTALALAGSAAPAASAAPGDLDTSFNTDGLQTFKFGNAGQAYANDTIVHSSGRIVAGGVSGSRWALAGFTSSGNPDSAFGENGPPGGTLTSWDNDGGTTAGSLDALVEAPDGKIIAAGSANRSSSDFTTDFALARYNADGTLDTTFGSGATGKVRTPFPGGYARAVAVVVQSDGKIVVVGDWTASDFSSSSMAVARYNADGSPDTSFDTDGQKTIPAAASTYSGASGVVLQSGGKIVLAGYAVSGAVQKFALVRLAGDGAVDGTFGSGGSTLTSMDTGNSFGRDLIADGSGRLLLAGRADSDSNPSNGGVKFALARYSPDGELDMDFGPGGGVTTAFGSTNAGATGVTVQPDGKIVLVGHASGGSGGEKVALARYSADGPIDSGFGDAGKVLTDFPDTAQDYGMALALQPDGKILAAGAADVAGDFYTNVSFALARYLGDTVDTTSPETEITGGPTGRTSDTTPSFDFTADEPDSTFECRFGTAGFAPCNTSNSSSGGTTTGSFTAPASLADGEHTFQVRATDSASNADSSAAGRTFSVDTTAPAVTLTAPGAGAMTDVRPTFSGCAGDDAGDLATVSVSVYSGSAASGTAVQELSASRFASGVCASGAGWSVQASADLSDGTYTARAVQSDDAAPDPNMGLSESRTFSAAAASSFVTITQPANGSSTKEKIVTFAGCVDGGGSVTLKIYSGTKASGSPLQTTGTNGGQSNSCTSGYRWQAGTQLLGDGVYTAQAERPIYTGDKTLSNTITITVDTTAPNTKITDGPPEMTEQSTARFVFGPEPAEKGVRFECRLDGGGFAACPERTAQGAGTFTTPELGYGQHSFEVRAIDAAGNIDASPAARNWTVAAPPANTAKPTIPNPRHPRGPRVGDKLTAFAGQWTNSPTSYTFKWYRCANTGRACSQGFQAMSAAEGGLVTGHTSDSHSYTLRGADVGRLITVRVVARSPYHTSSPADAAVGLPVAADPSARHVTVDSPASGSSVRDRRPTISGRASDNPGDAQQVVVEYRRQTSGGDHGPARAFVAPRSGGTWSGTAPRLAKGLYAIRAHLAEDAGNTVTSLWSVVNVGKLAAPSYSGKFKIRGVAQVNELLVVKATGSWSPDEAIDVTYRWQRCPETTSKATECKYVADPRRDTSYQVGRGDSGDHLRVRVSARNPDNEKWTREWSKFSEEIRKADTPPFLRSGGPRIVAPERDVSVGDKLRAEDGDWQANPSPAVSRQWRRCHATAPWNSCEDIKGATGTAYKLGSRDEWHRIELQVKAENPAGSKISYSARTEYVQADRETRRRAAVRASYLRVLGRGPSDGESRYWVGRGLSLDELVAEHRQNLKRDRSLASDVVERAYKKVYGHGPYRHTNIDVADQTEQFDRDVRVLMGLGDGFDEVVDRLAREFIREAYDRIFWWEGDISPKRRKSLVEAHIRNRDVSRFLEKVRNDVYDNQGLDRGEALWNDVALSNGPLHGAARTSYPKTGYKPGKPQGAADRELCWGGIGPSCTGVDNQSFSSVEGEFVRRDGRRMAYVRLTTTIGSILHDAICRSHPGEWNPNAGAWCGTYPFNVDAMAEIPIRKYKAPAAAEWNKATANTLQGRKWPDTYGPYGLWEATASLDDKFADDWSDDLRPAKRQTRKAFITHGGFIVGVGDFEAPWQWRGVEMRGSLRLEAPAGQELDATDADFCRSGTADGPPRGTTLLGFRQHIFCK